MSFGTLVQNLKGFKEGGRRRMGEKEGHILTCTGKRQRPGGREVYA